MSKASVTLSKELLDTFILPVSGRVYLYDSKEPGLLAQITAHGKISFYLYKKIQGVPERLLLGVYPDFTIAQARTKAAQYRGLIANKKNPRLVDPSTRGEMTFGQLFEKYMSLYSRPHKKSWKYDEREVNLYLSHWFSRKQSSITHDEVTRLHTRMGVDNGRYQANRILERIRSIYNKGIKWKDCSFNPAIGVEKFSEKSRDRFITPAEMPRLIQAIEADCNQTVQDYLWMLLLTGARRTNTAKMRFEQINWQRKEWRIPDTKNGEPVVLPLVDRAVDILTERKNAVKSEWVFPVKSDNTKPFNPTKGWERVLKRLELKDLRIHDLRRTFGSYQAIGGTSLQIIGKSLGHKSQEATQIYARLNLDPVRTSIEKATNAMLALTEIKNGDSFHR